MRGAGAEVGLKRVPSTGHDNKRRLIKNFFQRELRGYSALVIEQRPARTSVLSKAILLRPLPA
jgi:hypothetical protein